MSDLPSDIKKFLDDPKPRNAAKILAHFEDGIIVRLKFLTDDGGEIDLDTSKGKLLKAFKASLRKKKRP